jgi:hypothetical protein
MTKTEQVLQNPKTRFKIGGVFEVVCYNPDGVEKWRDTAKNVVVNWGLNHILDVVLHNSTQTTKWYVGLKNSGAVSSTDTLATHAAWTENSNYTGDRKEFNEAAATNQSITNSANKATFGIDTNSQTIAGAFLCTHATGTGAGKDLLCAADFSSAKSADNGDTLEVTYTISAADDGV